MKDKQKAEATKNAQAKAQEAQVKKLEKIYQECFKKFHGLTVNEATLIIQALQNGINQVKL